MIPGSFTIETERLVLKQVSAEDVPYIFEATRFEGFNDGMRWDPPATQEELVPLVAKNLKSWEDGHAFLFSAWSKETPTTLVGRILIRKTEEENIYEVGYWTHPIHQNKGYMTEIASATIELGFDTLGASEIIAYYATWNVASGRVLEKTGMTRCGFMEKGFEKHGKWIPQYKMSITHKKWITLRGA